MRSDFRGLPASALLATLLLGCAGDQGSSLAEDSLAAANPPNVLVIIADDLGWGDIGMLGSEIPTPNIDGLAAEGTLFTNFHTAATCSPSRAMLLTGVDSHLAGLGNMATFMPENQKGQPGYEGHLNRRVRTLGELFRDAGYATGFFGKWHLGEALDQLPRARGFEHSLALLGGAGDNWSDIGPAPASPVERFSSGGAFTARPEGFSSTLFTERLLEFLAGPAAPSMGKPFLAVLSFQAVHWPHHAPDEFLERHQNRYGVGWDEIRRARHERLVERGLLPEGTDLRERDPRIPAWGTLSDERRRTEAGRMAAYAAMLEHMDSEIGRVIAALDRDGRARDTIVVFVSDNGPDQSEPDQAPRAMPWYAARYPKTADEDIGRRGSFPSYGPQWAQSGAIHLRDYKGSASEGGMRVPFIVRYPARIAPGQQVDAFAFAPDLVPTLLDAAMLTHPATSDGGGDEARDGDDLYAPTGKSAWPVLLGDAKRVHSEDEAIGYELMTTAALFQGDHKIVRNGPPNGSGEWMLFDLASDPMEQRDLAVREADRFRKMRDAFDDYSERVGVIPVPEDYDVFEMLISAPRSEQTGD